MHNTQVRSGQRRAPGGRVPEAFREALLEIVRGFGLELYHGRHIYTHPSTHAGEIGARCVPSEELAKYSNLDMVLR